MISKQQAPQIRFIGFSDDWVQRELGHIAQFSKGSGYSKADLRVEGSPIILYGRLYTKYQTVIDKVDTFVDEKVNSIKSQGNEVIVPASGETAEDIARASAVKQKGIILGGDLNIVRLNDSYSPTFIALKISHGKSKSELAKKAQGKSVVHIRNSDLQSLLLKIPTFKEQTDIGNLFQNIDQTIALQRRKHEQTQTLKKSLLSKMFPQKGQKQPEIRLNGFSGDWVESELGEAVGVVMGQSPESKYYTNNPKDSILVQGNADLKNGRVVPRVWTVKGTKKASPNDIIMSVRAPVGDIGKTDFDVVIGRGVAAIKGNDFIYQMLMKMKIDDFWKKVSTGSTFESISSSDIKEALIMLPNSQQEQTAIGQFFKQFDDTLSLQAKQLKTLDNLKQALLAKMFV